MAADIDRRRAGDSRMRLAYRTVARGRRPRLWRGAGGPSRPGADRGLAQSSGGRLGMSYNKAWRSLRAAEERLGFPLLERQVGGKEGGGSRLSAPGEELLGAIRPCGPTPTASCSGCSASTSRTGRTPNTSREKTGMAGSGDPAGSRHRAHGGSRSHNRAQPAATTPDQPVAAREVRPAQRVWLQEAGVRMFGPGTYELLWRVDETAVAQPGRQGHGDGLQQGLAYCARGRAAPGRRSVRTPHGRARAAAAHVSPGTAGSCCCASKPSRATPTTCSRCSSTGTSAICPTRAGKRPG